MSFLKRNRGNEQNEEYHAEDGGSYRGIEPRGDNAEVIHNVIFIKQMPDNVGHKGRIYGQKQGNKHEPLAREEGLEPDLCAVCVG